MNEKEGFFPPFVKQASHDRSTSELERALVTLLESGWTGPPDNQSLAKALGGLLDVVTDGGETEYRNHAWVCLIEALIEALGPGTKDGWRLKVQPPPHRYRGHAALLREHDIACFFEDRIEEFGPGGYDSAIRATALEFGVSHGTVGKAHAALKRNIKEILADAERLAERLSKGEEKLTPRK